MPCAASLVERLKSLSLTISTAESCTGGLIAKCITDVPGASRVFPGSIVSYCDSVKNRVLGVDASLLAEHGAVSAVVACEMAKGVCRVIHSDIGISATGFAGPDGDVGLVYVGIAIGDQALARELHLDGNREQIRNLACEGALSLLSEILDTLS